MALVRTCFCCSVPIASGFLAAYLLVAYLIAFAFELLWILESTTALPAAAVLLCAGYFAMALFAALLIHGLATKNSLCLIAWMFAVTILTFPEAGLVIYMSIQYWRIESVYGLTELTCWLIRILINVIQLILIQSLYTMWKDEEIVVKRLRDLNMTAIPIPSENLPPLNSQYYQNNGYDHSTDQLHSNLKRFGSTPQLWNNMISMPYEGYPFCTTQSEFNASIFVPTNYINNEMMGKKCQSLMDLRLLEEHAVFQENLTNQANPWGTDTFIETSNYQVNDTKADSPRLIKCASMDALNDKNSHIIKNRTGFYAQPIANYGVPIYYGPLDGPDFLIYKKQIDKLTSKNSLSNASADDVQKYRDVAL